MLADLRTVRFYRAMRERTMRALSFFVFLVVLGIPSVARAYPWMIRHDYTVCATCHTDPSGGNLLTTYGRSLSQTLLSSELLANHDEEPGKFKDFAFGLVPLPESLQVGAFLRQGYIANYQNDQKLDSRVLKMRADVEAQAQFGNFRFDGAIGVLPSESGRSAREAWVTKPAPDGIAVVARTYWAAYEMQDGDALARLGRMNLPFGLRNVEHASWVRAETRTDINQHQQHGASYYWTNGSYRAEAMAVGGNFQMHPDAFRERGIVAYLERRISGRQALALQAFALRSSSDGFFLTGGSLFRQAYGAFYRVVPHAKLAVLAEGNVLVNRFQTSGTTLGHVAFVQADYEPFAGLHVMGTVEEVKSPVPLSAQGTGAWLSSVYFPVPHVELRFDGIWRKFADQSPVTTFLIQGQLYL